MRDAFGGAFMIRLLLVFIIIYVGFTAIALNYAKAFKVKNKVIEYLEENEIINIKTMPAKEYDRMQEYFETEILGNMNYKINIGCGLPTNYNKNEVKMELQHCENGIKIVKIEPYDDSKKNKNGHYYAVYTAFGWSIPFINSLLHLNGEDSDIIVGQWEINGETRTIVNE